MSKILSAIESCTNIVEAYLHHNNFHCTMNKFETAVAITTIILKGKTQICCSLLLLPCHTVFNCIYTIFTLYSTEQKSGYQVSYVFSRKAFSYLHDRFKIQSNLWTIMFSCSTKMLSILLVYISASLLQRELLNDFGENQSTKQRLIWRLTPSNISEIPIKQVTSTIKRKRFTDKTQSLREYFIINRIYCRAK